jgi:pimeloyl-ACP methyl ester carboxylesterase
MGLLRRRVLPEPSSFLFEGQRICFREYGSGPRTLVLTHGLLMDDRMYTNLGPALAAEGNHLVTVDMPGHGGSDQPYEMGAYSMTRFGRVVIALLDHLGLAQAVLGGTSLGANVALEAAVLAPHRVRGLVLEMPVLEHGIAAAAALFVPLALALRMSQPGMRLLSSLFRKVPRSHFMIDLALDFVRRDPASSLAVLDGLTFGRIAPPAEERRRLRHPALVIGHTADPIHPFSDADQTARELPNARLLRARSIYEWRVAPRRLDEELSKFLCEVWSGPQIVVAA